MLELGYLLLTAIVLIIIVSVYRYGLNKTGVEKSIINKRATYLTIGLLLWLAYVFAIAKSGFLANFTLPPRFPIFIIFPLFIFTGIVLYRNRKSKVFSVIPASWAVYFQSFRILVESLFVATVAKGFLHPEVTIEGYNYDMIFAITAPIIGYLVFNAKKLPIKVAIYWNYLGLAVLVSVIFVFTTTIFFPSVWESETSLAPPEIVAFPYILVAGFLMPIAVFVHIFSIIQLRKS
ncbi:hypothetical protein FBALC1_00622 [Flavobacteriales bacterium ALC-1]|nr:hypothetical protein FBALC1_00622 [Flavobacteriales bacterium ALC-1]